MLLAEKKMEEIEGTMKGWDMLEPFQERAMLNAILWGFHQGRNYTTGIWDVWNPSNKKVAAATTQPAQKQDKTWKNNQNQMLLAEKKMEEIEGTMKGWEHFQERAKLNAILWDLPKGEIILGVLEMSGTLQKKRAASTSQVQKSDKTWQNIWQPSASYPFLPPPTQGHRLPSGVLWKDMREHGRNRVKNERLVTIPGENQV